MKVLKINSSQPQNSVPQLHYCNEFSIVKVSQSSTFGYKFLFRFWKKKYEEKLKMKRNLSLLFIETIT